MVCRPRRLGASVIAITLLTVRSAFSEGARQPHLAVCTLACNGVWGEAIARARAVAGGAFVRHLS